jgi:hypothetical protein
MEENAVCRTPLLDGHHTSEELEDLYRLHIKHTEVSSACGGGRGSVVSWGMWLRLLGGATGMPGGCVWVCVVVSAQGQGSDARGALPISGAMAACLGPMPAALLRHIAGDYRRCLRPCMRQNTVWFCRQAQHAMML